MDLIDQAETREAEARACFTKHDLDGSNTINAGELATVLTTLGLKKDGVSDDNFKTLVDATLTKHDANADGVLQFEEFVTALDGGGGGVQVDEATLKAIFSKLDANGNGNLEKSELLEATKKFGEAAVAGVLADKLDLNSDGQIDFAEFCAGFAKIDMNKKLAVNALAVAAGVGLPNAAFVFIKPHANTEQVRALVKEKFAGKGVRIVAEGQIDAETIDKDKLIDQHYYAIASKATLVKPKDMPVPAEKFEEKFGVSWESALAGDLVFNAIDAAEKLGVDTPGLDKVWQEAKEAGLLVKFGGGFYCVGDIYVFNGFFMTMRSNFVAPGASVYYFSVEWDPADLKWASFRGEVLGPTDPASAPAGSLRAEIFANWESLGLPGVGLHYIGMPTTGENGVHASASPLEGLAERANWLKADVTTDIFGKALMAQGISAETIKVRNEGRYREAWSVDPQVEHAGGKKGSCFDLLEDKDADDTVATCLTIKA